MKDNTVAMGWDVLDRMEQAVEKVRNRLLRATAALNQAGIPYAVVGGHAVASWVAKIDEGAVRTTPDVDILVRREDQATIAAAFARAALVPQLPGDGSVVLDGVNSKPRDAVHLLWSGEKVNPDHVLSAPDIVAVDDPGGYRVLELELLVIMKLVANRNKDAVHVRDLVGVGLIDQSWVTKLPPILAERLQHILDTPGG